MLSPDSIPRIGDDGWHSPAVAAGQYAIVEAELEQPPAAVPPYANFLRAIDLICSDAPAKRSILDVGCGVGHYGTLLRRHRPAYGLRYRGTDSSLAMIAVARMREPELDFDRCDLSANEFVEDIVLMALAAECSDNPIGNLGYVMLGARQQWIIWHRVRLAAQSGFIDEPTYAGRMGRIWLWAESDLRSILQANHRWVRVMAWPERDDHLTIILGPADG